MPSWYRDPNAPAPNVTRRVGVIGLLERGDAVLLQRRSDDGEWDFIGGKLDEEETVLDALRREVREETGLAVVEPSLVGIYSDPTRIIEYPDGTVCRLLSVVFRAGAGEGEPRASEESVELRFVGREELRALDVWPSVRPIRDAYLADPGRLVIE